MRVYISGAITGADDYMERFKETEDRLTKEGMSVINPAHANSYMPKDTTYEEYMNVSFCLLDMCDAIYMMKGWEQSLGANREYGYAWARDMIIMKEGKIQSTKDGQEAAVAGWNRKGQEMTNLEWIKGMDAEQLARDIIRPCPHYECEKCPTWDICVGGKDAMEWLEEETDDHDREHG